LPFEAGLVAVTAAGAVLRLALLARQPLGYDEDFTAVVVAKPFGEMLAAVGRDSAPPLFYVIEWLVTHFWQGPASLRLVPAIAGIALIPLLAVLARRAAGNAAGVWAGALAAFLPVTLLSSENARMYSLAGALVVAATLLLWRATERTTERPTDWATARRWVGYGAAAAAAVWVDYFAAVALTGVLVAVAWLRPTRRSSVLAVAVTAVAFASLAPWLIVAGAQFAHAGAGFWIPPLGLDSVAGTVGQLFAGPPVDSGIRGREVLIGLQIVAVVAGASALAALAAVWLRRPESRPRIEFLLIACSGVVGLAIVSIWRPLLEARYAGVMWLPLFALAGVGLASMPRRLAAALVVAVAVAALALGATITHPETASLLPEIESRLGRHDLVAADASHYLAVLGEGDAQLRARLHLLAEADPPWYFGTAAYPPDAVIHDVPGAVAPNGGLVFWVADPGTAPPGLPAGYRPLEVRCAIGVCLTVYGPPGG
jgi:mannosyltransferase